MSRHLPAVILAVAAASEWPLTGCSSGKGSGCLVGQSNACACVDGRTGAQLCSPDGLSFGPCVCNGAFPDSGVPDSGTVPVDDGGPDAGPDDAGDGGKPTGNDGGVPVCVVGQAIACACTDGQSGAQSCQAGGGYGPCSCTGAPDAGPLDAGGITISGKVTLLGQSDQSNLHASLQNADSLLTTSAASDGTFALAPVPFAQYALGFGTGALPIDTVPAILAFPGGNGLVVDGALYPLPPVSLVPATRLLSASGASLVFSPKNTQIAALIPAAVGGANLVVVPAAGGAALSIAGQVADVVWADDESALLVRQTTGALLLASLSGGPPAPLAAAVTPGPGSYGFVYGGQSIAVLSNPVSDALSGVSSTLTIFPMGAGGPTVLGARVVTYVASKHALAYLESNGDLQGSTPAGQVQKIAGGVPLSAPAGLQTYGFVLGGNRLAAVVQSAGSPAAGSLEVFPAPGLGNGSSITLDVGVEGILPANGFVLYATGVTGGQGQLFLSPAQTAAPAGLGSFELSSLMLSPGGGQVAFLAGPAPAELRLSAVTASPTPAILTAQGVAGGARFASEATLLFQSSSAGSAAAGYPLSAVATAGAATPVALLGGALVSSFATDAAGTNLFVLTGATAGGASLEAAPLAGGLGTALATGVTALLPSPDGKKVAFAQPAAGGDDSVSWIDATTTAVTPMLEHGKIAGWTDSTHLVAVRTGIAPPLDFQNGLYVLAGM